jgi:hypothetical protein
MGIFRCRGKRKIEIENEIKVKDKVKDKVKVKVKAKVEENGKAISPDKNTQSFPPLSL